VVESLRVHCGERLADYKVPRHIWFLDALPRGLAVGELKPFHLTKAMERFPHWANNTKHDFISAVKRAFNWAADEELIERSPLARVSDLGATVEGRDLNLVTIGTADPGRKALWVIARQHPGETMAEWFVEGLLDRLLDPADPVARRLLERAVVYVVPNMNPDGSVRGNLRTNAAGANLNREWMTPSLERSPEVWQVRAAMQATGVDAFLDIHGDEGLPYVFTDGNERLPTYSPRMEALEQGFASALVAANPDFQTVHGYPADKETKVNLTVASKWVGHSYGGLALTLEMPFKDNADLPDPERGWNGARSRRLGADTLTALLAIQPSL